MSYATGAEPEDGHSESLPASRVLAVVSRILAILILLGAALPYLFIELYLLPMVITIMQDAEQPPSEGFRFLIDLGRWRLVPLAVFLTLGLLCQLIPSPRLRYVSAVAAIVLLLLSLIAPIILIATQYLAMLTSLAES